MVGRVKRSMEVWVELTAGTLVPASVPQLRMEFTGRRMGALE